MTNSIYLIGNNEDIKDYKSSPDVSLLPVKNLPMAYFPFFYSSSESSIEKMKRLIPLFEGSDNRTSRDDKSVKYTVDTDKLFASLAVLEENYQPYNNNNIYHITTVVILSYIIMMLIVLKIINYFFQSSYMYIISGMISILLIISLAWALVVPGKSF